MPTATTNLYWWFYTLFSESYEDFSDDEDDTEQKNIMADILVIGIGDGMTLKDWCREYINDMGELLNAPMFLEAILNTVDWVKLREDLLEWYKENYEDEEVLEQVRYICDSCQNAPPIIVPPPQSS